MEPIISAEVILNYEELYEYHYNAVRRSFNNSYSGFVLIVSAFCLILLIGSKIIRHPNWVLFVVMLLIFLLFVFMPSIYLKYMAKREAKRSLKSQQPQILTLYADKIIETPLPGRNPPYSETNMPLNKLYMCYGTKYFFTFYVTPFSVMLLPKRLLSETQIIGIENILVYNCGNKYKPYLQKNKE